LCLFHSRHLRVLVSRREVEQGKERRGEERRGEERRGEEKRDSNVKELG